MKKKIALFMCLSITTCLAGCSIVQLRGTVPEYKQETYTSSGNISSIVLCDTDVPIEICNSNNDEIVLCYYNADHKSEIYVIEEADGILTVDKKSEPNYGIFIFGDQYNSDSYADVMLKMYIPNNYMGDLSVESLDGNITIKNITIDTLSVDTNDGDVLLSGITITRYLFCKTKDGDVKAILNGVESEYNLKIKTNESNNTNSSDDNGKKVNIDTDDGKIDVSFYPGKQ